MSEAEAAKRIYTTYGKKTLEGSHGGEPRTIEYGGEPRTIEYGGEPRTIEPWTPVEMPAQGGWRFFKVGVEMR